MAGAAPAACRWLRVLLDDNLPHDLRHFLTGHDTRTAAYMGYAGLKNGELLARAASDGLEALLTMDSGIEYQQKAPPVAVLIVRAKSNTLDDLRPLVPAILAALETILPRTVARVG